jgi:hypothetical protein
MKSLLQILIDWAWLTLMLKRYGFIWMFSYALPLLTFD